MGNSKICECTGKFNFLVKDIVFKAEICPECKLAGSTVSLILDTLSFKSTDANLPNYFSVAKGTGLSVSGSGVLTLSEVESKSDMNAFYTLYLFDSSVGKQNLASLTFFTINQFGAIKSYAISFVSNKVSLSIAPNNELISSVPVETSLSPEDQDIISGKIIIVKDDQVEIRELS